MDSSTSRRSSSINNNSRSQPQDKHHHPLNANIRQPLQLQIPLHQHNSRLPSGPLTSPPSMLASFYSSFHSGTQPQHTPTAHLSQQTSPKNEEYWYSLEGYLLMKSHGGALNFLQSKKKLYFGLDELENRLIYYKDKADFVKRRDCLGTISLDSSVCSLVDGNLCAFTLQYSLL